MILRNTPPEGFLETEERCNFKVPAEMKKVWAVQIDLMIELIKVCQKHGLRIYADGGTLIGAVRHQGFIPWDDDIDMAMLREDYDKLVEIAPKEFSHPYFFQCIYTDNHYDHRHAQLRNCETASWPINKKKLPKYNHGIFIDIFVLDGMPNNPKALCKHYSKIKKAKMRLKLTTKLTSMLPESIYQFCREKTSCLSDKVQFKKYEDLLRSVPCSKSFLLSKITLRYNHPFKEVACYGEPKMVPFEYTQIPIMENYDQVLKVQFGDYMTPTHTPTYHGTMNYDTEHSYLDVLKMK